MSSTAPIPFDNTYTSLPPRFYSRLDPTPVAQPGPVRVNRELAAELGLDPDWLASEAGTAVIAGNAVPEGAEPLAAVYAGHQFGSYNPQLGDGRAILLGEVVSRTGERFDIQLKGSGPTPYSRGGDGRAPLGPVLREYLVSEAMHTLGVPTSRALAAVTTGETVWRDRPLPGAVLARVARSHIRIGTVEFFAARGDTEALELLVGHSLERHYPQLAAGSASPALALLEAVIGRQARLVSQWQLLGFIHGVMNTDNMLLSGETIDYGPCAFMDGFHPDTVFSSIDHGGRYAYRNQPAIAHWNLAVLAQRLLPLIHADQERAVQLAQSAVDTFPDRFADAHWSGLKDKLGLFESRDGDRELAEELFELMAAERVDFTLFFRRLTDLANPGGAADVAELLPLPAAFLPWLKRWQARCEEEPASPAERQAAMYRANPVYIPRNHLVEEAIAAAEDHGDFDPFHALAERLARPFEYDPAQARYARPPAPGEEVHQTFCGT